MIQDLGEHGKQIQGWCSRVGSSCYWPSCGEKKNLSFPAMRKCLDSSDAWDWAEPGEQQGEVWGHCCKRVEQVCLVFHLILFFVGFRFIALLKDCVLTSWQVYCQVGQLWQSEQLYQVEHGLWQYGVNRWISKAVAILAAIFFSGKYTVTVLGTSSGPYNNSYSTIEVQIFGCCFGYHTPPNSSNVVFTNWYRETSEIFQDIES